MIPFQILKATNPRLESVGASRLSQPLDGTRDLCRGRGRRGPPHVGRDHPEAESPCDAEWRLLGEPIRQLQWRESCSPQSTASGTYRKKRPERTRGQIGRFLPSQELQGPDTEKQPCQSEGSRNPGPGQAGGSEAWASQRGCGQRCVVRAGDQLAHEVPAPQKGKPRTEKPAHHNECPCLLQLEKALAKQRTPTTAKK